jgi:hypothetical protein
MATRAERFHANEQRTGKTREPMRPGRTKPGLPSEVRSRAKAHAARKALYALEETADGRRPSRKSTRRSANRAKPDATLNGIEELRKGSPQSRFRKEQARAARPRGKVTRG